MAKLQKEWVPLDISAARGKSRNRIYRVGLELEGGWDKLPAGTRIVRDGSVAIPVPCNHVGEMPSGILDVSKDSATYWGKWLKTNFPHHVNETCGMHVHASFKTAFAYNRLMTAKYPATIVEEFRRWSKKVGLPDNHPIWPRLDNKSRYCQHYFDADCQVDNREKDFNQERKGHRYTVINYCYGRYSTLECRLLPMMKDVELSTLAVQEFLDITNAFLVALPLKKEPKERLEHKSDDEVDRTSTRLYV